MATLREWLARLLGSLGRRRGDADLEEELQSHAHFAQSEGSAPRAGLAHAMDAMRDQRGLPWIDDLVRDLRHASRLLRRSLETLRQAVGDIEELD